MSEFGNWKLVMLAALSVTVMFSVDTYVVPSTTAHAQVQQKTVCVLQPIDQSISLHVVNMTLKVLAQHNETSRYIGIISELTNKSNPGCDYVIQFERAVNSNYNWVDKTAPYTISGNTLTLYTDKTPVNLPDSIRSSLDSPGVLNPGGTSGKATSGGDVIAPVMTNWSCFGEAQATFHQNANGFTGYEVCNPYAGRAQTVSDQTPFYVIHKSLEDALTKMSL
ncbi:MAG: hypothetical protein ACREBI_04125 [Nitrosotalea sp.]